MPVALCGILIFYQIATERASARVIKTAAGAIVLAYVIYLCGIMPAELALFLLAISLAINGRGAWSFAGLDWNLSEPVLNSNGFFDWRAKSAPRPK